MIILVYSINLEIKPFTADELHIQDLVKQFTMADPPKEKKKKNMMNGNLSSNSVESLTLSIDSNVAPIIKGHKSPEIGFFKVFGKSSKTKIEKSERISE